MTRNAPPLFVWTVYIINMDTPGPPSLLLALAAGRQPRPATPAAAEASAWGSRLEPSLQGRLLGTLGSGRLLTSAARSQDVLFRRLLSLDCVIERASLLSPYPGL